MFAPYRLAYLGVVSAVAGLIALVSAAHELGDKAPATTSPPAPSVGLRSLQEARDKFISPTNPPADGTEKGSLKEAGAHEIYTVAEYQRAVELSRKQPVLIFKHSTECTISGAAYRRMAEWLKHEGATAPEVYVVKVIERKSVSQEIATRSGVVHESPQVILFNAAKPVWTADHEAITAPALDTALAQNRPKSTTD